MHSFYPQEDSFHHERINYGLIKSSFYHTAIWSLYRQVVCNVPVYCKANRDRNQ